MGAANKRQRKCVHNDFFDPEEARVKKKNFLLSGESWRNPVFFLTRSTSYGNTFTLIVKWSVHGPAHIPLRLSNFSSPFEPYNLSSSRAVKSSDTRRSGLTL
jgi:hypothetical protein